MLSAKIIGLLILLVWYFQHKYRPFLFLILVYLTFFISDLWRLFKVFNPVSTNSGLLAHKIIITLYAVSALALFFVFKGEFKK